MCACAGSLTRRFGFRGARTLQFKFASCGTPEASGLQEIYFQAFRRPGQDGPRPARQGFMSTQRRENRDTPAMKTSREVSWFRTQPMGCMERAQDFGETSPILTAQFGHACARGVTAWLGTIPAMLATNSLQSDDRITPLVRLATLTIRRGSPPPGAGTEATAVALKSFGLSTLHIPSSSGPARLHRTLPRVPAAMCCRTERYDGKGNLYFEHAA